MGVLVKNPTIIGGGGEEVNLQPKSISVSSNGITSYNPQDDGCDGYSEVEVNVSVQPNLGDKTITSNGSYYPFYDNLEGYNHVDVSIPIGSATVTFPVKGWNSINASTYGLSGLSQVDLTFGFYENNGMYFLPKYDGSTGTYINEYCLYGISSNTTSINFTSTATKEIWPYVIYNSSGLNLQSVSCNSNANYEFTFRDRAFCNISTLQGVFLNGGGHIYLGDFCFADCANLTSVGLGGLDYGVYYIGENCFGNCYALNSVQIGTTVQTIKTAAFSSCSNLYDIQYMGTIAQWNNITKESGWYDLTPLQTIHCSDGDITL